MNFLRSEVRNEPQASGAEGLFIARGIESVGGDESHRNVGGLEQVLDIAQAAIAGNWHYRKFGLSRNQARHVACEGSFRAARIARSDGERRGGIDLSHETGDNGGGKRKARQ